MVVYWLDATENPRVDSSILSLATIIRYFYYFVFLVKATEELPFVLSWLPLRLQVVNLFVTG